jgi:hypothetical protein
MKATIAVALAAMMGAAAAAGAQSMQPQSNSSQPDAMQPGLGEIMSVQQMRHIKLWFAGHAGNWPLADYEIGELKEGFDDISKLIGGDTVDNEVGDPIKALEKVVADKDRAAFPAAFDKLSAGCNACHKMLERGFIAIQRPTLMPYSNQSFAPKK